MFKKPIKDFQKTIKIIFCFILILGLFIPLQKANADLLGIIDTFNSMFEGIEEKSAPLAKEIITVFFTYVIGLVALYTSSNFLDLVIREQINWLTLKGSPMVQAGYSFVSGLANLFLILVFLAIAIAYILKIETFQAKKALPKLIIVALLLNFSLVFIGALVDVSNILYNTVLQGNTGLATQFIEQLGVASNDLLLNLALWIALLAGLFIIPFVGPFAQLGFVLFVVGVGFLPNIMTWIFQIVLFLMIAGVFFTYVFLFSVRVFIIQILAILAPLAFVCLILPQTKKYWDEWLKHLIGWTFLGIFLLFFLVIGIKAADAIVPPEGLTPIPFLGWGQITAYFAYYFFMFIYFILVIWVSKRFMPTLAAFIIAQTTSWSGVAWRRAAKPFGRTFEKSARRVGKEKLAPWLREKIGKKRVEKWTKAPLPGAEERGVRGAFKRLKSLPTWTVKRTIGKAVGPGIVEAKKREINRAETAAEKIMEPTLLLSKIREAMGMGNLIRAIGFLSKAIEKGKGFKKEVEKEIKLKEAIPLVREANKIGAKKEAGRIARAFISKENLQDKPNLLKDMGFKEWEDLDKKEQKEWKEKGYKTALDKLIEESKGDDIKDFAKGFWKTPEAMKAIQLFWGGGQISKAAQEFRRAFVDDYMKIAEKLTPELQIKLNPQAALYRSGNAAQDLGFRPPGGMSRREIRTQIKEIPVPPGRKPTQEEIDELRNTIREVLPKAAPEEKEPEEPPSPPPGRPGAPPPQPPPGRVGPGPTPGARPRKPAGRPGPGATRGRKKTNY